MALNCRISKGVADSCTPNVAGINRMVIVNWSEEFKFTSSTDGCVDTVDLGSEKAYEFAIMDGTGQALSTGTVGSNASSRYHVHQVNGQIAHLDCDMLGEYNNFFMGKFIVIVETKNRDTYAFGVDNGLTAEAWTYDSGTGEGDANGITFTFSGAQPNPPVKIASWDVVKALVQKA